MPPKKEAGQSSLSSWFSQPTSHSAPAPPSTSKRPPATGHEIDLTLSDSDSDLPSTNPPLKKPKLETLPVPAGPVASSSSSAIPVPVASKQPSPRVSQWLFDPTAEQPPPSPTKKEAQRREAFADALLAGTAHSVLKKKSYYLQKEHFMAGMSEEGSNSESGGGRGGEEDEALEDDEDEDDEDDAPPPNRFGKFAAKGSNAKGKGKEVDKGKGKATVKYTPLEQQVIALKQANPGVVLMVEVSALGRYKYRFFQEDAQIASRTLGIACFPSQHMLTASVPTHRLNVHVKRLINAGFKVGVVQQQETAALKKAGDNKSGPFTRAVSAIYTSATFIDELSVDPLENAGSATATLMCLVETEDTKKGVVRIGMVAVMPSTGEIVYDDFEDGVMRSELETRMLHLQPRELILQKSLTKQTESMVSYLLDQGTGTEGVACRIERIAKKLSVEQAQTQVADFYAKANREKNKGKAREEEDAIVLDDDEDGDGGVDKILDLPSLALVAVASLQKHLKSFGLDTVFLHTHSFTHFSTRSTLTLNGNTLANLEILRNQTDYTENGSLISVIDHCKTAFGRRLLRKWVSKPLVSLPAIQDRLDAVEEILGNTGAPTIVKLRELFRGLPDLERGLVRIHFGRATPSELLRVLQAFQRVANVFDAVDPEDEELAGTPKGSVKSVALKRIVGSLPGIKGVVEGFLEEIDAKAARDGKKAEMFKEGLFEEIQDAKDCLAFVQHEMSEELTSARKILKSPSLEFKTVGQDEFLLEVRIAAAKRLVPDDWVRINSTKQVYRYRTPSLQKKIAELEQCRETLAAESEACYKRYLKRVAENYELFRAVVQSIATADCLFSFATTANAPGYVRPEFVKTPGTLEIVGGRHPIVEALLDAPYVPNDVKFGDTSPRQMILTGSNMGGKSSTSRMIALVALMSQIGSFVPADSVKTSTFDGIYTRMGASDDLARGRSTFMVELSETSEILKLATPRSLIVLDELGRGTSTHDGQAIASAVLQHILTDIDAITIFITHYPQLAEVSKMYPHSVSLAHMACLETPTMHGGFSDVTFLYKLTSGLASKSHGLNVARLAGLPDSVVQKAFEKAHELDQITMKRILRRRVDRMARVINTLNAGSDDGEDALVEACKNLLHEQMTSIYLAMITFLHCHVASSCLPACSSLFLQTPPPLTLTQVPTSAMSASSVESFFPPGFSVTGGIPVESQDFSASIVFAVAYSLLVPLAIMRIVRSKSRCFALARPSLFVAARIGSFVLRAYMARGNYTTNLFIAEQVLILCGFVFICSSAASLLGSHLLRPWAPTGAKQPLIHHVHLLLELALYVAIAIGAYAGSQYGNLSTSSQSKIDLVKGLRDANVIIYIVVAIVLALLAIYAHAARGAPLFGSLYLVAIAGLLIVSSVYKLVTYLRPPSPVGRDAKIVFYCLSCVPEFFSTVAIFAVNLNWTFGVQEGNQKEHDNRKMSQGNYFDDG
ncbi:DNA mismatch repair protein MSH3 [Pseudohyphozyma bogoriensis]|nr:DNA mismatch repair protein MSH3 [Pseudohyphozyma bogoriensis]